MMVAVRRAIACSACVLALGAPIAAAGAQGGPPATGASETRRGSRAIERQLQERVMRIMKERLSLNDEQLKQLNEVTQQFEQQRRSVRGEDYRLRMALRSQLMAGDSASQDRVAELLERMPGVERRRIDLMEAEQRELAKFLSPVQRARFLALQDEIRRNMEEIRNRRTDSGGRTGAPPHGSRPPQQL
jgi:hypothetical protein